MEGFLGGQPVGGIFLGVGEGLFEIGNLSVIGLFDLRFKVVDLSRVNELSGVKIGDGFQGGLGLFRSMPSNTLSWLVRASMSLAPSGGFRVDGGNFVHEVGDVIRNLRTIFGNPYGEAVLHHHMAVFVELEFHGILLGSGYASRPGYSLASRHDRRAGPHNWA